MAQDCLLRTPEDFVFPLLPSEELKDKYRRYLFRDYVEVFVFSVLNTLSQFIHDLQNFCLECLASLIRTAAKLYLINKMWLLLQPASLTESL